MPGDVRTAAPPGPPHRSPTRPSVVALNGRPAPPAVGSPPAPAPSTDASGGPGNGAPPGHEGDAPGRGPRRAEAALRLLADAGAALTASLHHEATLRAVADLAVADFARWCVVFVADARGDLEPLAAACAAPGKGRTVEALARRVAELPHDERHPVRLAFETGTPQRVGTLPGGAPPFPTRDEGYGALLARLAPTAVIAAPLTARGRTLGVLLLGTDEPGARYDDADVELAAELARRAALALEASRLFAAEQSARRAAERTGDQARRLQQLAAALSRAVTPQQVADMVVHTGLGAVGADAGSLAILDDGGATFVVAAISGYPAGTARRFQRFPVDERLALGRAVRRETPVFLESLAAIEAEYPEAATHLRRTGYEAYVALPITSAGRPVGGVSLSFRDQRAFDEGERNFLLTLATLAGQAMERARLFAAEREAREAAEEAAARSAELYREKEAAERRLDFLARASGALSESLDFRVTLETVARLAVPHLADWCAVDVLTPDGEVELLAVAHVDPAKAELAREIRRRFPPDPTRPGGVMHVIRTGEPALVPAVTDEMVAGGMAGAPDRLELARALALRSYLCVPMIARGRTLGAITLVATDASGRRYGPADVADVQEVARRAGLAVDNARLFEEAERAGRARSDFLAVMSHELRTPLNAVLGYAALLADGITGPVNDPQRTQLARIQASARHLLLLVDEVLTLARLEAGTQRVHGERVDLHALAEEAVHLVEPTAAMRGLRLELSAPEAPVHAVTDPTKLRQVLLNLLSNAAKFTAHGGITVRVWGEAPAAAAGDGAPAPGALACVSVEDTGPGIAAEHLERIFEPFYQVEQRHTRVVGGTGLGLAVSRRLARLMGGDVTVASRPGRGSTFTVRLPADAPPPAPAADDGAA